METIIAQSLSKNPTQKDLEMSVLQLLNIIQFTQEHIEKTDQIKSIKVKNEMFTLSITPNK